MIVTHKLDISSSIIDMFKEFTDSKTAENENKKEDDKEFKFRIKTKSGTDINIPGSFIGLMVGLVTTNIIIGSITKIIVNKKEK